MNDDFELFIEKILKTEQISPDDRLSKMINALQTDELDEEQLDLIAAAQGADYDKLKKLFDKNKW